MLCEPRALQTFLDNIGDDFDGKLNHVVSNYAIGEAFTPSTGNIIEFSIAAGDDRDQETQSTITYHTSRVYLVLVSLDEALVVAWAWEYKEDPFFSIVLRELRSATVQSTVLQGCYKLRNDGLIFYSDNLGNTWLCMPKIQSHEVLTEMHDGVSESVHAGYHKTYQRISSTHYWPKMSHTVRAFVQSCDICQKIKPKKHGAMGQLQPIRIPTQPYEVVSMDFITELPKSKNGFDAILVIVDKLTKYTVVVPTHTTIGEVETARLFFHYIIAKFGLPLQVISDRDVRWRGAFWEEICRLMGMQHALTTSYHPQADGQTEILNQFLEIGIWAYIGGESSWDAWDENLDQLTLAYNGGVYSATGVSPAFLLRGFSPRTGSTMSHKLGSVSRPSQEEEGVVWHAAAQEMADAFANLRLDAQDSMVLAQITQEKAYNKGRLVKEFQEGDLILINRESLHLNRAIMGRGVKFLPKYEGPFEVITKISAITYQIRLPSSYPIHSVISIAHLKPYHESPGEFGMRMRIARLRVDFGDDHKMEEWEVDRILGERWVAGPCGQRQRQYEVQWKGYGPKSDSWELRGHLRNAPRALAEWEAAAKSPKVDGA